MRRVQLRQWRTFMTVSRATLGLALLALVVVAGPLGADENLSAKQASGKHGMVAAAHPLAVQAGTQMLAMGGNAADAAAATAFALAVVEPFGSSLGGDGTALVYTAETGEVDSVNYRCAAPQLASVDVLDYSDRDAWAKTPKAAGVPGMVAGTCYLHAQYGSLPLATVMAPAIRYAEEGYEASDKLAAIILDNYELLESHPEAGKIFLDDGIPVDPGAIIRNPDLAASLRLIAEQGPRAFYTGSLAHAIDAFMQESDGLMRSKDLAAYTLQVGEPLHAQYRGLTVYGAPPPFGGLSVLQNLNVISHLPLDFTHPYTDPVNLHLIAEGMKGVSRDRDRTVGDPEFVEIPVELLLSEEYAIQRASKVRQDRALARDDVQPVDVKDLDYEGNTTHLSVVDADGNAIALTQTLGKFFGCGVMVPGTGILLNNQVTNFSSRESSANRLEPGKRVRSTQSPTIVSHGNELLMVVGSPGNYRIITTVVQVLVNYIDYGMSLWEAVDAARFTSRVPVPQPAAGVQVPGPDHRAAAEAGPRGGGIPRLRPLLRWCARHRPRSDSWGVDGRRGPPARRGGGCGMAATTRTSRA